MIKWLTQHTALTLLFFIVLLGLTLRTYNLTENPPGFFADEASIGYNAYTILNYGTDEYGEVFPFFFRAFGEYKNPVQTYSTVPFIALFGLNEFSVRLPSVLYGILGIVAIFLLTRQLFHAYAYKNPIGLLAAFFLAISPWHIHFSRTSLEGLTAYVAFATLGTCFFLRSQKQPHVFPASIIFFVLAFYSYFPARLFIPLFSLFLFLLHYHFFLRHKKIAAQGLLIAVLSALPILTALFSLEATARWQQVSIFSNPPENQSAIRHVITNYLSHFSPSFLFTKGDVGMPGQFITRHSVRGMGELYLFQLPLILAGLFILFKEKQNKILLLIFSWLLFYPTGSMLTVDQSAQATRSIIGVIPFQLLSAFGITALFHRKHRYHHHHRIGTAAIGMVILVSLFHYLQLFFVAYPKYSSDFWGWQYGAGEIVRTFDEQKNDYEEFIMAPEFNAPHIFLNFYAPNGCTNCIIGLPHEKYDQSKKQLFAVTPAYRIEHSYRMRIAKTILHPNGSVAFEIGEVVE